MSVSGIVSGMDWEGMISTMIESAQKPAQVQMNKRINLTNKKTLFEEMQELAEKLQKSTTALRLESTYKAKKVETERIDSNGSAKGVLTASVNADAAAGVYTVKVNQLAQSQTIRSDQITNSKDVLKDYVDTSLWFTQNGQKVGVTLSKDETLESLSSKINNTIKTLDNPMAFATSVVDNRLIFKSDESGLGNVVTSNADALIYASGQNTTLPINVDTANLNSGDFVIKDDKGNTYTNGVDFDIVDGNQIRWRTQDTNTVKVGDDYKLKYEAKAGDKYTSEAITRGSGNIDTSSNFNFTPYQDETLAGRMTITDAEGFTYNYGTDFDFIISNDDTTRSIRWLKGSGASRPDEGVSYNINYTCGSTTLVKSSELTYGGGRSFSIYNPSRTQILFEDIPEYCLNSDYFSIIDASGDSYTYGTDFTIIQATNTQNPRVKWEGDHHPDDNETYHVNYNYPIDRDEVFDLDATRGNTDILTSAVTTAADATSNGNAVITATTNTGTATYTEGVNFTLDKDANGNITVNWIEYRDAPLNGVTYDLNMTTRTTGEALHLKGVKTSGDSDATSQTVYMTKSDGTVYYEGVDFTLSSDEDDNPIVKWNAESTALINPNDSYTLKYSFTDGSTTTYNGTRSDSDAISMSNYGFTQANGSITEVTYGGTIAIATSLDNLAISSIDNTANATFTLNWGSQTLTNLTAGTDYPAAGAKLTYEYKHSTNTFSIDDDGTGLLQLLGIKDTDGNMATDDEHYTAAQNAIITVDGEEWTLATNELEYENDILNGVKMELKGTGTVIVDVTHDTDKAVENVQTFIDDFNVLMDWINIRSTEKQVNNITILINLFIEVSTRNG